MRRRLLENLGWKLLSLAIAVLLWIVVVGEPRELLKAVPAPVRELFGSSSTLLESPTPAGERR
ncbi:MAG: hypothetical protein ACE141_04695 [Bryobacteraceae bacterium]